PSPCIPGSSDGRAGWPPWPSWWTRCCRWVTCGSPQPPRSPNGTAEIPTRAKDDDDTRTRRRTGRGGGPMTPVSAFTARADEMLNALERVVTLESPSAQIEVVQRCVAEVAKLGESLLGETPDRLSTDAGHPLLRWQFGD